MKKSRLIQLGLTSAVALSLAGCSRPRRCIDESRNSIVVEDRYCQTAVSEYPYRWYYGGSGFGVGSHAYGGYYRGGYGSGSATPSSSGTTRGGFGGTAEGHGSSGSGHGSSGSGAGG